MVDAKKDLNAYALVDGQAGCCSPAVGAGPEAAPACCDPAPAGSAACCVPLGGVAPSPESSAAPCCAPAGPASVHDGLAELIRRHDINDFAASVRVYAVTGA